MCAKIFILCTKVSFFCDITDLLQKQSDLFSLIELLYNRPKIVYSISFLSSRHNNEYFQICSCTSDLFFTRSLMFSHLDVVCICPPGAIFRLGNIVQQSSLCENLGNLSRTLCLLLCGNFRPIPYGGFFRILAGYRENSPRGGAGGRNLLNTLVTASEKPS